MSNAFAGTWALIVAKRRVLMWLPILCGLVPALFFGLMFALSGGSASDLYAGICFAVALATLMFPLVASWDTTFAGTAGQLSTSRREEFFALPMGRLAIPTSITALGVASMAAFVVLGLLGLNVTVGVREVFHVLFEQPDDPWLLWTLSGLGFVYFNALACLGTTPALTSLLAPFAAGGVGICVLAMGHSEDTSLAFLWGNGVVFGLYYLALPFVLYARKRHHWELHKRGVGQDGFDQTVYFTLLGALVVFGVVGVGVTLFAVLGLGGYLAWRLKPERHERSRVPSLRLTYGMLFVMMAPVVVYAWSTDQAAVAAVTPGGSVEVMHVEVAPDERHVAVEIVARGQNADSRPIQRVAVVDLTGEREPILFESRFASVGGWSADGRFLAVHDGSLGRLGTGVPDSMFLSHWDALRTSAATRLFQTVVLDTKSGEVESLGVRSVAAGWRTAEDLISLRATWGGDYLVRDGVGNEFVAARGAGVNVLGYEDGRPLVTLGSQLKLWTGTELVDRPAPTPLAPQTFDGWEVTYDVPGKRLKKATIRRGDDSLKLWKVQRVFSAGTSEALLVLDCDGFKHVSLPDGEQRLLLPLSQTAPAAEVLGSVATTLWVSSGAAWSRYDAATATLIPAGVGRAARPVHFFADGRVLVKADGVLSVRSVDGSGRRLLPEPTSAAE